MNHPKIGFYDCMLFLAIIQFISRAYLGLTPLQAMLKMPERHIAQLGCRLSSWSWFLTSKRGSHLRLQTDSC